jgi:hypothetical protein
MQISDNFLDINIFFAILPFHVMKGDSEDLIDSVIALRVKIYIYIYS